MTVSLNIASDDFWVKIVGMLQQNWALVDASSTDDVRICFITDASEVFDEIRCSSCEAARAALRRNGFERLADSARLQSFLKPPEPPFIRGVHPSGPIYSSGRYWR